VSLADVSTWAMADLRQQSQQEHSHGNVCLNPWTNPFGTGLTCTSLWQYIVGFFTGLLFLIAVLYGLTDLDALFETAYAFPLGEIYRQDTGTGGGGIGLLFLVLAPTTIACLGCYLTASRVR
jgi:hypothetical protein